MRRLSWLRCEGVDEETKYISTIQIKERLLILS